MSNRSLVIFFVASVAVIAAGCAALQGVSSVPPVHPEELEEAPTCTECHEASDEGFVYARFNHTPVFVRDHRMEVYQQEQVCSMCHTESFCNDCHVTRVELKPSLKLQTENYRQLPHRGDYLSRHQIDGRIDPTSCFRCHGNPKSAQTCNPCHGN